MQQGWIKLIKSDSKDIYNVTKAFYFNLLFIKESWKYITMKKIYHKISGRTTIFNTENNNDKKCFLSSKSAYQNYFWKIMWLWRRSNDAENSALPSQE